MRRADSCAEYGIRAEPGRVHYLGVHDFLLCCFILVSCAIEPSGRTFSALFLLHPLPNIGRTILELDALGFGMPKKTDDAFIHES